MLQPRLCVQNTIRQCQFLHTLSRRAYASETISARDAILPPPDVATMAVSSGEGKTGYYQDEGMAAIRKYKPRTPGVRHLRRPINDHLYLGRAHIPLTYPRKGQHIGGRNNSGKVAVRHRGGGAKRRIRVVDFARMAPGKHLVERIEHDPGRSAHIALLSRPKNLKEDEDDTRQVPVGDGVKRVRELPKDRIYSYIVAPQGMRTGELVESFRAGVPKRLLDELGASADAGMIAAKTAWRGNCLPLHMIPTGTIVYNIGLYRGKSAQLCRAAGTYGMVVNKNDEDEKAARYVDVRLQSGEVRKISRDACATVGVGSNANHNKAQLGKAGRSRHLGIRPTVRGVAMNACDHPHGGGRGKSKGNVHPVSIWGQPTKSGYKTRKKRNINRYVVTARPRTQGRKQKQEARKR